MGGMDMDMVLEVSAEELVSTQLDLFMSLDLPKDLASAVLSPAILVMVLLPMAILLVVSALELVFTPLDQFMSPGLPRVLVREVLMLSLVITHRTTGPQLSPPMDTPLAMDAVASVALSPEFLVLAMGMDMVLEVSAEELVSTQLDQSMSQDQHRVSVVDTCTRLLLLLLLCNMLEINIF